MIRMRNPDIGNLTPMVRNALSPAWLEAPGVVQAGEPSSPKPGHAVGTPEHVRLLAEAHYRDVYCVLRRLGVPIDGLEDATQHVFLVAASKPELIRAGSERSFLISVAVRTAANARRARNSTRARRVDADASALPGTAPLADELVERHRLRNLLDRALDGLAAELREPFVLFELEGLTLDEIAEALAIPRGTVASRLRRARELFLAGAKRLKAQGFSGEKP